MRPRITAELVCEFRGVPSPHRDARLKTGEAAPAAQQVHRAAAALQIAADGGAQPSGQPLDPAAELVAGGDDHLGSRRRSRRAEIRHEIGDREVHFVADG